MIADPRFTVLSDKQKTAKKAGGEETFSGYESIGGIRFENNFSSNVHNNVRSFGNNVRQMNAGGIETQLTRTKRNIVNGGQYGGGYTYTGSRGNGGSYGHGGYPSGSNPTGNHQEYISPREAKEAREKADRAAALQKVIDKAVEAQLKILNINDKPVWWVYKGDHLTFTLNPNYKEPKPSVTPVPAPTKPPVAQTDKGDNWVHKNGETSFQLNEVVVKDTPIKPADKFSVTPTPLPNGSGFGSSLTGRRLNSFSNAEVCDQLGTVFGLGASVHAGTALALESSRAAITLTKYMGPESVPALKATAKYVGKVAKVTSVGSAILGVGYAAYEIRNDQAKTHTWVNLSVTALSVGAEFFIGAAAAPYIIVGGIAYGVFSIAGGNEWLDRQNLTIGNKSESKPKM